MAAGVEVPDTAMLRIVQGDSAGSYFLLHLDRDGREVADTWHETIDAAMAQATWEFQVKPEDWSIVES